MAEGTGFAILARMLSIANKTLPASDALYMAFRISLLETMERIALAEQLDVSDRSFGYLTQVPFLKNVHPGVQLDQLLLTWSRQMTCEVHSATLVDESVLYAVCETASQVIRTDRQSARRIMKSGPHPCDIQPDFKLADQLQQLHLGFSDEGHFLLISQFLDIPPLEADDLKRQFGIEPSDCECMFELVGRYRVSPLLAERARGLLTSAEIRELFGVLRANLTRSATA